MATGRFHVLAHALALLLLVGCSVPFERNDWEDYDGPGAEYFQRKELTLPTAIPERCEPVNRSIAVVNHGLMVGIVDPVARVYRFILPQFVRTGLSNFGRNLAYPKHLLNNLLQAKWKGAGNETLRFLSNTTVGVAGLWDPATSLWNIESSRENFGRTLAKWGWNPQMYLMLPLFGPSSGRNLVGSLGDTATEPQSYLFPAAQLLSFNTLSGQVDNYKHFTRTQYDPYELGRYIYTFTRWGRDPYYDESEYASQTEPAIQTLQTIFFEPLDPGFPRGKRRSAELGESGRKLPFNLWLQPEPAPLVYIIPGLGSHREATPSRALAELAFREGFSAVTISSVMNFDFIQNGAEAPVPGFAPADFKDIRNGLTAIHESLEEDYPGRVTSASILGVSLGAFHTLFLAAADTALRDRLPIDRYIAIAPPVQLIYGVERIDDFYNAPLDYPQRDRLERVENLIAKVVRLKEKGLAPGAQLPFSKIEAEFLIGLSFRIILQDVIHCSQLRDDLGVLKTRLTRYRRANSYKEILEFSYMEYFYAFVLPYFSERSERIRGPEDVIRLSDLRTLEESLAGNEKIRILTNQNDFLYAPGDLQWLRKTFGNERLRVFKDGGHLGNLPLPEVRAAIAAALRGVPMRDQTQGE